MGVTKRPAEIIALINLKFLFIKYPPIYECKV